MHTADFEEHSHPTFGQQAHELIEDLEGEVTRELHHDTSQSDALLQKHAMGLIILLYVIVAVILTAAIAVIWLYYRPH
jgi:hypothetical protein